MSYSNLCLLTFVTALGLSPLSVAAQTAADSHDKALTSFQFDALATDLRTMPRGPERSYFTGMIANAENRLDESETNLSAALPSLRTGRTDRAACALQALADDYAKQYRYAEAAATDDDLIAHFSAELSPARLKSANDDDRLYHVLTGAPAESVSFAGSVRLKTKRNTLGLVGADLTVNGISESWVLDTGANISVVTESFAKTLGLNALSGATQTRAGLTGIENPTHVALIPVLTFGGAVFHNVVVLILPDESLNLPYDRDGHRFQINAILGYPVFQALGRVTFSQDGELLAGESAPQSTGGARMFMKELTPVIEGRVEGQKLPFSFDTGASETELFVGYSRRFHTQAPMWRTRDVVSAGAGGAVKRQVYVQSEVQVGVGDRVAVLHHIAIDQADRGTDNDGLYGNLGQDMVAGFDSFTLDFARMRFNLGRPLASEAGKP